MPAPYSGGCQCGQVRYDLTGEPLHLIACHCSECQNQSGSAFGMSMIVKMDDLKITAEAMADLLEKFGCSAELVELTRHQWRSE